MSELKRNTNLDFFRVLIMFMVVLGHSLVHGGILNQVELFSLTYYWSNTLRNFLYVHINCFVILSGFLGYQKNFSCKKVMRLWLQVFFWSVLLFFVVSFVQGSGISIRSLVNSFLPITQRQYWFMTTYFLMYLVTPFLNKAISSMSRHDLKRVLIVYFLVYILLQNLIVWKNFTSVDSTSPMFFCFLYSIGAYLHKYPPIWKRCWIPLYIGCCSLLSVYQFVITSITLPIFGEPMGETLLGGYSSVLVVTGSIAFSMIFINLKMRNDSRLSLFFAFISPLTLGVYLIHDNGYVRELLWSSLNLPRYIGSWYLVFILILTSIIIFAFCISLEWIRVRLFHTIHFDSVSDRLGGMMDRALDKICMR